MEAHDPSQHSFGQNVALAAHLLIEDIDGLPPPRKLESNMTTHGIANSLGSLAAETPGYQARYVAEGNSEITVDDIIDAAISGFRSNGVSVGPFRKRKIQKILRL